VVCGNCQEYIGFKYHSNYTDHHRIYQILSRSLVFDEIEDINENEDDEDLEQYHGEVPDEKERPQINSYKIDYTKDDV
jgi:hypothetical protein